MGGRLVGCFHFSFIPRRVMVPAVVFGSPCGIGTAVCGGKICSKLGSLSTIACFGCGGRVRIFSLGSCRRLGRDSGVFTHGFTSSVSRALVGGLSGRRKIV